MYLLYEHESDSKLSVQALNNTELNGSRWVNIPIQCLGSIDADPVPYYPDTLEPRHPDTTPDINPPPLQACFTLFCFLNPEPRSKKL